MGYKYSICYMLGNQEVEAKYTQWLIKALFIIWTYKPKKDYAWISLKIT
jgi:hypothetical protein